MARRESTPLRDALSRMFPEAALQRVAALEGVVQRQRKVEIVALFWVLILSVGSGKQRTLADLRRSYWSCPGYAELCIAGAMPSWGLCGVEGPTPRQVAGTKGLLR